MKHVAPNISFISHVSTYRLKLVEGLLAGLALGDLQGVELHGLAERSAFSDSDDISNPGVPEAGGEVDRHVLVPLLEPVVLLDVVKVITPEIALHVRSEGKIWSLRCEELRKSKPLKMLISKSSQIF